MDVYTPATLERTVHIPFHYVNDNIKLHYEIHIITF